MHNLDTYMKLGIELISLGIHPLKWLFATFLWKVYGAIIRGWLGLRIIKINPHSSERTYKSVKGKPSRALREPVNWLFCT